MAWVDIGPRAALMEGSATRGYAHFQYDSSDLTGDRSCRIVIEKNGSNTFNVMFQSLIVDNHNYGTVSGVTQNWSGEDGNPAVWTGDISGGRTVTASWTNPWYAGTKSCNITGAIPASVQTPSGLSCTVNSVAWNSVNGTFSVSNWGGEPTGSSKYIAARLFGATGTARREETATNTNSITRNITTSSAAVDGGITVKGAGDYRIDTYASNSAGSNSTSFINVYTPPSPLSSITYTETQNAANVTVSATITGGSSTDNYSNTVTTYWRYSTDGGTNWSAWASAGTGTPWTAKSVSFVCDYNTSVKIQAKQTYQSKDSEVLEESFTSTIGVAPSNATVAIDSSTWNSVTMSASADYGMPSALASRYIAVGVNSNDSTLSGRREVATYEQSSVSGVVVNNSSPAQGGGLDLKGMAEVYPYVVVSNGVQSISSIDSTAYYLPPAPGQLSYSLDSETATTKTFTVTYVGVAANNIAGYTQADLYRTVRWSDDGGTTWTDIDDGTVAKALTTQDTFSVTVQAQESVIVEAWLTYKGKNSTVSSVTISNNADPVLLYGGASEMDPITGEFSDPESKLVVKLYGSVNGESVKITKLYGSVEGVAREVYEDAN